MSTLTTTVIERYQPVLAELEQTTLLGFLAGYREFTREACALDLRQFTDKCWQHHQHLFDVRRVDIECFARDLEDRGKARATVGRRLCTVVEFFRYACLPPDLHRGNQAPRLPYSALAISSLAIGLSSLKPFHAQ